MWNLTIHPLGGQHPRWHTTRCLALIPFLTSQTSDHVSARRLSRKGEWAWGGVPIRTWASRGGRGWIGGSHINWRRERVPVRTLVPKGGGLWDPTSIGKENETFFIRVWKPLPSRRVLKTLRGSPKGIAQRGQYLLMVGLGYYNKCWIRRCKFYHLWIYTSI